MVHQTNSLKSDDVETPSEETLGDTSYAIDKLFDDKQVETIPITESFYTCHIIRVKGGREM